MDFNQYVSEDQSMSKMSGSRQPGDLQGSTNLDQASDLRSEHIEKELQQYRKTKASQKAQAQKATHGVGPTSGTKAGQLDYRTPPNPASTV